VGIPTGTISLVDASAPPHKASLIDINVLAVAAGFSVVTMIVLVVYEFVLGALVMLGGLGLAYFSNSPGRAMWAARLFSVGLGLWAGPAVYFTLWAVQGLST
jgi:hypothetical protein